MNNIVIVIVNWNTGNLLAKCLQSLYALPEKEIISKIYIVDNDSQDDSLLQAKQLASQAISTEFIEPKENLGFAGANNLAITEALSGKESSDHILLLNPDTEVKAHAISAMKDVLERNSQAGIVGPKLLNSDKTLQPSVRAFPSTLVMIILITKLSRFLTSLSIWKSYLQTDLDYGKEQPVDQVMGAAFLIRNDVVHALGGLDDNFWIWFEEVDYCKQAYDEGWEVIYTPTAEVIHHGGVSFDQVIGPKRVKPFLNSIIYYAKKHLGTVSWVTLNILRPFAMLMSIPSALFHMQFKKKNIKRLHGKSA